MANGEELRVLKESSNFQDEELNSIEKGLNSFEERLSAFERETDQVFNTVAEIQPTEQNIETGEVTQITYKESEHDLNKAKLQYVRLLEDKLEFIRGTVLGSIMMLCTPDYGIRNLGATLICAGVYSNYNDSKIETNLFLLLCATSLAAPYVLGDTFEKASFLGMAIVSAYSFYQTQKEIKHDQPL